MKRRKSRLHLIKNKNQKIWLPYILSGVVYVLLVLQVVISNRLAVTGKHISQIEEDLSQTQKENTLLRERIASASSLLTLKSKVKDMGFEKQIEPIYLSDELPIALSAK